jgi:hypothetical protein
MAIVKALTASGGKPTLGLCFRVRMKCTTDHADDANKRTPIAISRTGSIKGVRYSTRVQRNKLTKRTTRKYAKCHRKCWSSKARPYFFNHFAMSSTAVFLETKDRLRVGHVFGVDERVEFFASQHAELHRGFAQADVFVVRGVRDLGGVVVADLWRQRGH